VDTSVPTIHSKLPVRGRLALRFAYHAERQQTSLDVCEQQPPLQVVRAFPLAHGGKLVHLHNLSGGVLGGDCLELTVEVGPQATVQLTTTSATRLYRSRADLAPAQQSSIFRLGAGSLLEYLPDQLIPFAGSRYQQHTRFELAEDAGLFWWETLAPGRLARGERFSYQLLQLHSTIFAQRIPIAVERLKIEPILRPHSSLTRFGPYSFMSTFYICSVGTSASAWSHLERNLSEMAVKLTVADEILWGVSTLVAHGLVVRCLSREGRHIAPGLFEFWRIAKRELYGQEAVLPRKVY
jgi:urease accessory protein